ncbi:MAG: hypothetical protein N0E48_22415, partial [Candidatus Thiodiazotropha endolucinida]|nr:hypothetical protein [Candidatus Thiodiazotropha taylori]MCW4346089.1 hypothetical protein [Candidatus Thiodiazotropha endolucinida]
RLGEAATSTKRNSSQSRNKKNKIYHCKLKVYCIKDGFKSVRITQAFIHDEFVDRNISVFNL